MPSATDNAISEALVEELATRAKSQGYRSLLNGDELAGSTTSGFTFKSDSDHESGIYSTADGEARVIPTVYLKKTLGKQRGGVKAFVAADPKTGLPISPVPEYRLGSYMCFLHPDHPGRAELEEMGIGPDIICGDHETTPAAHIRDEFNLRMHESHKHPISHAIREEYMARRERDEAREEQRRHTEAILSLAQQNAGGTRQKAG